MAKTSERYWEDRTQEEEAAISKKTNQYLSKIKLMYQAGKRELEREVQAFYKQYATENGMNPTELKKKLKPEEWKAYQSKIESLLEKTGQADNRRVRNQYLSSRVNRLQALQNQVTLQLELIGKSLNRGTLNHLQDVYQDSYYHNMYEMGKAGLAGRFDVLNPKAVEETCKIPWSGKSFSERVWDNTTKLKREATKLLSVGSICGTPMQVMSRKLAERMNVSYSRAECLVRTESSRIYGQTTADGYQKVGVKRYKIVAALDLKTSKICRSMDGKTFDLREKKVGKNSPPFHPRCRTMTIAVLDKDTLHKIRKAKDKDGKWITVPADMTYSEWYNQYIEGNAPTPKAPLPEAEKIVFVPAKSKQEAVKYAKEQLGFEKVQLTNLPVDSCNEINRSLTEFYATYPTLKGFTKELKADVSLTEATAAASAGYQKGKVVTYLHVNPADLRNQEMIVQMIEAEVTANDWTPKNGIQGVINHELAHLAEAQLYFKEAGIDPYEADPVKSLNETITRLEAIKDFSKSKIAEEIVTQAFDNLGIPLTAENIEKEICRYANYSMGEALAECISENDNGKKRRVAAEVTRLFMERVNQ